MRDALHWLALGLGYLVLGSVGLLLTLFVGALVRDALRPVRQPAPLHRSPLIGHYSGCNSPHRLQHPVLYVDADTASEAWSALGGPAA